MRAILEERGVDTTGMRAKEMRDTKYISRFQRTENNTTRYIEQ